MPHNKIEQIKEAIAKKESTVVAFSGGVDSAVLAALAFEVMGRRALAVTADFLSFPGRELKDAIRTASEIGIPHRTVPFDAMGEPGFAENTPQRCYYCKKGLIRTLAEFADGEGFNVILEGTNASEIQGYRPGWQAIREAGDRVFTPFVEFGVTKEEVREIARVLGLSVADRPSMTCLSTRFPYGQPITEDGIERVESAEEYLTSLGFNQFRVRDHGSIARIEIMPSEFDRILQERERIVAYLKKLGFTYITLDMEGFRSGSMDEVL
ncbi:MAG: ATP-dependent sacrificial sulfur transferase LarE [Methanosarcinaceae archaeon]|nr:ATP-dependent sacrificial sulfur transferase LarE [Methanosarcinaceae archaeon]